VGTVGGGCVDGKVFDEAKRVLMDETPRQITVDLTEVDDPDHALICGGKVDVFLEPLVAPNLYVCGAGHVGQALAKLAVPLGFRVTAIDDRAHFLNEARFPGCHLIMAPFSETLAKLEAQAPAYVAVVTRGHAFDQECLEWGLRQPNARYVGLIGSRVKIAKIRERALEKGFTPEQLAKVRGPIGLDIGAVSVEEIAVSIAAELIAVRRMGDDVSRKLAPCATKLAPPQ
jgi:xanthine dehydrogenase accessory factor